MYNCGVCHMSLSRKDSLKRHMNAIHNRVIGDAKRRKVQKHLESQSNDPNGIIEFRKKYEYSRPSPQFITNTPMAMTLQDLKGLQVKENKIENQVNYLQGRYKLSEMMDESVIKFKHPFTCKYIFHIKYK